MFADIIVHLDASAQSRERLQTAVRFAGDFRARLIGLYVISPDPWPMYAADAGMGAAAAVHLERAWSSPLVEEREAVQGHFTATLEKAGVDGYWFDTEGRVPPVVTHLSRAADLVVVGQDAEEPAASQPPPGLAGDVCLRTGRPTLVVPYAGSWVAPRPAPCGIAWNGSREAARAVHDALPVLARAEKVTVVTVAEAGAAQTEVPDDLDLKAHLARHGVDCQIERIDSELDAGDVILARITDLSCDLLVMGAYGHSRIRELVLGGVTRQLLREMTVPVLMSH